MALAHCSVTVSVESSAPSKPHLRSLLLSRPPLTISPSSQRPVESAATATATAAAPAKKYGADITVVVIDQQLKELLPEHDTQLASIRWHLSEGEGSKPTAIIGEVADDMSMEAIHSKHVDADLLAKFIPCPVLLLPL